MDTWWEKGFACHGYNRDYHPISQSQSTNKENWSKHSLYICYSSDVLQQSWKEFFNNVLQTTTRRCNLSHWQHRSVMENQCIIKTRYIKLVRCNAYGEHKLSLPRKMYCSISANAEYESHWHELCLFHIMLHHKWMHATWLYTKTLPPTPSAALYHSLRVFLQVHIWMDVGDNLEPTEHLNQSNLSRILGAAEQVANYQCMCEHSTVFHD